MEEAYALIKMLAEKPWDEDRVNSMMDSFNTGDCMDIAYERGQRDLALKLKKMFDDNPRCFY